MVTMRATGIVVAASLVSAAISVPGAAVASQGEPAEARITVDDESRAEQTSSAFDSRIASATDSDLILLLIWGRGGVPDEHPEIRQELGFPEDPIALDEEGVNLVVSTFLESYPEFSERWARQSRAGTLTRLMQG